MCKSFTFFSIYFLHRPLLFGFSSSIFFLFSSSSSSFCSALRRTGCDNNYLRDILRRKSFHVHELERKNGKQRDMKFLLYYFIHTRNIYRPGDVSSQRLAVAYEYSCEYVYGSPTLNDVRVYIYEYIASIKMQHHTPELIFGSLSRGRIHTHTHTHSKHLKKWKMIIFGLQEI